MAVGKKGVAPSSILSRFLLLNMSRSGGGHMAHLRRQPSLFRFLIVWIIFR